MGDYVFENRDDMNQTLVSDWQAFRRVLQQSVADGTWERWLDPLKADEQPGCLILLTQSDLHTRLIVDRYLPLLNKAAEQIYGEVQVEIRATEAAQLDLRGPEPRPVDPNPTAAKAYTPRLMHRYTFETFVVGSSNRFAHAATQAVAEAPGTHYNPLFIHGGAGLGKTHLLQAVGHLAHTLNPQRIIRYVSSEGFLNDFIDSLRHKRVDGFKAKYRAVDILLLDDVQFFEGKEQILEEFFHTFNSLYESGKQMVISSDRHPRNLSSLEDRLRSRFEWGLLTDIQSPDIETRLAILKTNVVKAPVPVPHNVLEFIASHVMDNIRELEGALTRVAADAHLNGHPASLERAIELLGDLRPGGSQYVTCSHIIERTADSFGFHPDELVEKSRKAPLVLARQIAMYLCRELTDHSLVQIGGVFRRDHSTVVHAVAKINSLLNTDKSVLEKVHTLSQSLRTTP